jgi:hypothetical protein
MTMKIEKSGWKVTADPGRYFVGDPCYFLSAAQWEAACSTSDRFQSSPLGIADRYQILGFRAALGSGAYLDQNGAEYRCTSGLIGLTNLNMIEDHAANNLMPAYGRVVEFTEPTLCSDDGDGRLRFGEIFIDTNAPALEGDDDE